MQRKLKLWQIILLFVYFPAGISYLITRIINIPVVNVLKTIASKRYCKNISDPMFSVYDTEIDYINCIESNFYLIINYLIAFISFMIYYSIGKSAESSNDTTFYMIIFLLHIIVITVISQKRIKLFINMLKVRLQKNELYASILLDEAKKNVELSNNSKTIREFLNYYDSLLLNLIRLEAYENKVNFSGNNPSTDFINLQHEEQQHLRDALEREVTYILEDDHASDVTYLETAYINLCDEIKELKNRFDNETLKTAEKCKDMLHDKRNEAITFNNNDLEKTQKIDYEAKHNIEVVLSFDEFIDYELLKIDLMKTNGYKFENFTADLLLYNGFVKTEVTQKSNDYGVDVIAINPDGVKYAIQCKCYSDKLGNKPVQEITAGMKVYNCQVGVVFTNNYFTENAKILAASNNILLWDRDKLRQMIIEKKKNETNINKTKFIEDNPPSLEYNEEVTDTLLPQAIELAIELGQISISMIQRHLKIGYIRASQIIDQMETRGIISSANGSNPRKVYVTKEDYHD